jgi:hypothetical protein
VQDVKILLRGIGFLIGIASAVLLFLVDMWSLVLLAADYGIMWAFIAFVVVPAQIFVPFLVGTWIPALALTATTFLGFAIVAATEE